MSNLTPKNNNQISTEVFDDFWGALDQTDFAIPTVKIGQPQSVTDGIEAGKFCFNSGLNLPVMPGCKLIVPRKTRVLYGKGFKARSVCGSDDYYKPSSRYSNPISHNCMTCPAAQWGDTDPVKAKLAQKLGISRLKPPLCAETYNLLMADQQDKLFFIGFQRSQLKLVQEKLFSRLRQEFAGHPPFGVQFDMRLEEQRTGDGKYYAVVFENFSKLEDYSKQQGLYQVYSKSAQEILAKQNAAQDAEKEEPPMPTDPNDGWEYIEEDSDQNIPF